MIVYASRFNPVPDPALIKYYADRLPSSLKKRYYSYKKPKDAQLFLMGKLLLLSCLMKFCRTDLSLDMLQYNRNNKPFFSDDINFNISHSGDFVLCAASNQGNVGIDIEEIVPIDYQEFKRVWTADEWKKIISSEYPLNVFYDFWTKKESVIKADGRGLEIPLNEFEVINNSVCINSSTWHLQELIVNDNYKAHLATSHLITDHIVVQHVNVFMKASFEICSMLSNEKF